MCQNIDDFNRCCASLFAVLYGIFPRAGEADSADPWDSHDTSPERLGLLHDTVEFLAAEGYLVYQAKVGGRFEWRFSGLRLTAKGLAALSRIPEALPPVGETVGARLVKWDNLNLRRGTRGKTPTQLVGRILGAAP